MLEINKYYYFCNILGTKLYFRVNKKTILGYVIVRVSQNGEALSEPYFVEKRIENAAFPYFFKPKRQGHYLTSIFK